MKITRGTTTLSDANPVEVHFDAAAAAGTATEASRADHLHEVIDPAAPVTQAFGDTAAVGVGLDPAREDHRHGMMTPPPIEMFIYPAMDNQDVYPFTGAVGNFAVALGGSALGWYFTFKVPDDFASLVEAVLVVIPDATETLDWHVYTDYGAAGELHTIHSESAMSQTRGVTVNVLAELDVSGAMTGLAAGDYVGLRVRSNVTSIRVIGLQLKYATG